MRTQTGIGKLLGFSFARISPGLTHFLGVPLLLATFGATAYGEYARVWAATLFVVSLCTGWIRQGLLRAAGLQGRGARSLTRSSIASAILLPTALAVASGLLLSGSPALALASAAFAATQAVYLIVDTAAQRDLAVLRFALAANTKALATVALPLLARPASDSVPMNGTTLVFAASIANLLGILFLVRRPLPPAHPSREITRFYWRYGAPMAVWLAVSTMVLYMDRIALGLIASPETVGAYAALSDLTVRGLGMVAMPFTMLAHPVIMRVANREGDEEGSREATRWTRTLGVVLAAAGLGYIVFAPIVLPRVAPGALSDFPTLAFLTLGAILWQQCLLLHKPLEIRNRTMSLLWAILAALGVEVIAIALLAPTFATRGVSFGMALGAATYCLIVLVLRRSNHRPEPKREPL